MVRLPPSVTKLITSFERLPGIGPKTAARLTFYLLNVPQEYLTEFGSALTNLKRSTLRCEICFTIDEESPCFLCRDRERNSRLMCIVEQPLDVLSFERTGKFKGRYHVLHGVISPLDNIGPDELTIGALIARLKTGEIDELILATNSSVEGEATAMYIAGLVDELKTQEEKMKNLKVSRLAHGLPIGGDIEYADEMTLTRALEGRREY